ncbi:Imm21 family immunity protein [Piscinibacter sp. XHJ-5]|uniref:Imm21 family immunity protein n=1 Tax=Piscinibacter sp. XHJ-5 TaxID=3037797 RepID=UPI002452B135|nr:Imm21 family immunity protein [Piscinibacter sp. XHJ-5]
MIEWIDTLGPPLCGTPDIARTWQGTEGSSIGTDPSDYDRACAVVDHVTRIACGPGEVLLLGDEPMRSAFLLVDETLLVARWWSCESVERAETALRQIPWQLPIVEESVAFLVRTPRLVMFDSAHVGIEPSDLRETTVTTGAYAVTSERYEAPGVFKFIIHRFLSR